MQRSAHIDRVTLLLAGLSAALLQIALDDRQPGSGFAELAVSTLLTIGLHFLYFRHQKKGWSAGTVAGIVGLGVVPLGWYAASRSLMQAGQPAEVQLTCVLRNLMLGLVAAQHLPRARGLAALSSLFLVLTGFLWATNAWTITLLVTYAIVGMWWLIGTYWELLGGRFADETEPSAPIRPAMLAIGCIALISLISAPFVARTSSTTALQGFFPSSGGTQWHDPYAHGGVGDGDQMIAAQENASSFGPVESELFLESEMPSLYDAFNEFSEDAPKKLKQARRAIPLGPSSMQMNHQKKGITQKATREFSTVRQQTKRRSNTEDHLSKALLLISGRTPAHLALETYDHWDGRSLIATESSQPLRSTLKNPDAAGFRWVDLSVALPTDVFTTPIETQVRVVNLRTERVPTPPNTTAVTMDKLHSATMFSRASDGSLAMDVDHIPQLTIFRLRSALRDRSVQPELVNNSPQAATSAIGEIAAEWTAGTPRGWPQVTAVIDRLRSEYEHDPQAMAPETADAVEHFLVESKRGPDYLFAASAAVLLKSLGYETRVRSGLYASPDRFELVSRLTTVLPEDIHFWVEVKSSGGVEYAEEGEPLPGTWITLEPTPGYDLLYAPETLLAYLSRIGWSALTKIATRPITTLLCCCLFGFLYAIRRTLLDTALLGVWSIGSQLSGPRELTRFTLRLLEWRAWLYGRSRPVGAPLGRWDALSGNADFLSAACWALYGEGSSAPLPPDAIRNACRSASRTDFRQAA